MLELTPPTSSAFPRRLKLAGALLLLPIALTACSNTRDVYASGPWGPPRPRDAATTIYGGPWNGPQYQPAGVPYPASSATTAPSVRVSVEPMEPIGPWAKRGASPIVTNGNGISGDYSQVPPEQAPAPETRQPGASLPSVQDARPAAAKPAPRPSEKRLTSLTGNWNAHPSGGPACRLHLSSVAALDLYRASTAQCSNKALQNVNAWNLRNGDIVLYSQGNVVLRARGEGDVLHGALEGTSTVVKLSR